MLRLPGLLHLAKGWLDWTELTCLGLPRLLACPGMAWLAAQLPVLRLAENAAKYLTAEDR